MNTLYPKYKTPALIETYKQRSMKQMDGRGEKYILLNIGLFAICFMMMYSNAHAAPVMEATFGSKGESGIWFDPSYNVMSPLAQKSTPGVNFAGAGGINAELAQVHEFDAAVSTTETGGAGYFLTESAFGSVVPLTVTPTYTDVSPAQTGLTYIIQHYLIENLTAASVNDIWFMSYLNADLFRANNLVPAQRVGLLNDEKVTASTLAGSAADNLIFRQYQNDGTEIYFHGMLYRNGVLAGADSFLVEGPGTPSGGGDALYDEIYYNGAVNFSSAQTLYASGVPIEYSIQAEYAQSIGFDIGTLLPGEVVEVAIALSTEYGLFVQDFFYNRYLETFVIPEPLSVFMLFSAVIGLFVKKSKKLPK
ncbi:MAG: hypothetical protein H7A34_03525 [bacterium]|nr:hypothetical protein [bacterium]